MIGSFPSQMRSPIGTIFGPIGILHVVRVEGSLAAVAQPVESQFGESGPDLAAQAAEPDQAELLAALGAWTAGQGPLYHRLARALRLAIERGDLPPGTTLPPERRLAPVLAVGRGTVVAAYETLRQAQLVDRRQGSGTRVLGEVRAPRARRGLEQPRSEPPALSRPSPPPDRPVGRTTFFRRLAEGDSLGTIDLVGAYLLGPGGLPPLALEGVTEELLRLTDTSGYLPRGYAPLRTAIAEHLSRGGLPTTPDQVLVTGGAQQALDLLARHLVQPGLDVVLEDPTYPGAIDVLESAGGRLVAVPTGRQGVDVGALSDLVGGPGARLMYLIPTFHNPVGGLLSERRRREVARLLDFNPHTLTLIEDASVCELVLDDGAEPPPPIAAYAPRDARVFLVGSTSKLFWGGLRVGWIRAPEPLIAQLERFKTVTDLGGSLPSQVIAARLFEHLPAVRELRRRQLTERLRLVEGLLHTLLPTWTWEHPLGGACLWVKLPYGHANQLAQLALRHGVSVVPGPVASPHGGFGDYLRLPFSLEPDALEEGLRRLARAWAAYQPSIEPGRQSLSVVV